MSRVGCLGLWDIQEAMLSPPEAQGVIVPGLMGEKNP